MKGSILLFTAAVLCSSILRAAGVCTVPDTIQLACIYTNFGSAQSYQQNQGLTPGYTAVAVSFTPAQSFLLMSLEVAAYRADGSIPDAVNFAVYNAAGGFPGDSLESFSLTGLGVANGSPAPGTITASSVLHPYLAGGSQYWIVMSGVSPGDVTWNSNSAGRLGAATLIAPGGGEEFPHWGSLSNYAQGTFALDGDPRVPEPGTFALGFALVGAGVLRRRSRG